LNLPDTGLPLLFSRVKRSGSGFSASASGAPRFALSFFDEFFGGSGSKFSMRSEIPSAELSGTGRAFAAAAANASRTDIR
jgi:hypothetical protein